MNKFENTGSKDTRSGFGSGLSELGRSNPNVVALCADVAPPTESDLFKNIFPNFFGELITYQVSRKI